MAELLQFPDLRETGDGTLPDAAEREQALDVRASWIVEAPAGSGKTGLLIQRYLKLLGDASVDEPEGVLAITFTVKATGELRERVVAQLEGAVAGMEVKDEFERQTRGFAEAVLRKERERGWGLLENPRRLNLRTIDSVCAEIAGALPVLSGSGGRMAPVTDAEEMYREAARRTLMQLGGADQALDGAIQTMLLHRDGHLAECERLIGEMLAVRNQWGRLIPLDRAELDDAYLEGTVLPQLEKALDLAICQALTQLSRSIPEDVLRELTEAAEEFAHFDGYQGEVSHVAMCANQHVPPGDRAEHLAHWRALIHLLVTPSSGTWRKAFGVNHFKITTKPVHTARLKGMIERLQGREDLLEAMCRLDKLPPATYPLEQWVVAKALFRVLSHALVELQMVFAERGQCDFVQLGLAARTALSGETGAEDLAAALGTRTRHLLVDEMQDTSSSQYELIERLTQGWDGQSQTLFLVGDPKQSIYRFRQARVERFVRTMKEQRLGEVRLRCLRLTANFRSQRGLVERFNDDFAAIFPRVVDAAYPEEVPFSRAVAVRGWGERESVVWHAAAINGSVDGERKRRLKREVARESARDVRQIAMNWLGRPLPDGRSRPWQVAVLVRSRADLGQIVAEFQRDDGEGAVPFRAVEIDALGERQEVLDLFGLTRALLHRADRVAWLAVLHAPWCGLGLADLHMLAGADDVDLRHRCVLDLAAERGHMLSEEGEARLSRVWPVLDAAMELRERQTMAQLVERTWRSLGGDAYLDPMARANAARFFELLDELEAESGMVDVARLKKRMTKLYAESSADEQAVELITIHKAKGLEWDVVIVPGLEKMAPAGRGRLLEWMEVDGDGEETAQVVLAPIAGKGTGSTELRAWIRSVDAGRERAERKRLLYVASTRAKEELHLFATPERKKTGVIEPASRSMLKSAWPAAKVYFDGAATIGLDEDDGGQGLALAASATEENSVDEAVGRAPRLQRLRLEFDPLERFRRTRIVARDGSEDGEAARFERPEGSLPARAFGNAVHAFLQMAAERLADGVAALALVDEVAGWRGRAEAVLRGDGLAPAMVERTARRVVDALATTLRDAEGRWVLGAHRGAANEVAMTGWVEGAGQLSVRLDRMFHAGPEPRTDGDGFTWIVDYKTASHGEEGLEEFLAREKEKYRAQMETYARSVGLMKVFSPMALRVGLYYPVPGRFVWWVPEGLAGSADADSPQE